MAIPDNLRRAQARATNSPAADKPAGLFVALCRAQLGQVPTPEHRFHESRRWRFDYAFVTQRVALEVEGGVWSGGRHTRPRGFLGDIEKYNAAAVAGWLVLRCTPDTLTTTATLDLLRRALAFRSDA